MYTAILGALETEIAGLEDELEDELGQLGGPRSRPSFIGTSDSTGRFKLMVDAETGSLIPYWMGSAFESKATRRKRRRAKARWVKKYGEIDTLKERKRFNNDWRWDRRDDLYKQIGESKGLKKWWKKLRYRTIR